MNVLRTYSLLGIGAAIVGGTVVVTASGCSSSSTSSATNDGGSTSSSKSMTTATGGSSSTRGTASGGSSSSAAASATTASNGGLPPKPSGGATTSTTKHNLAVHYLYLGDTEPTPALTVTPGVWKTFGYNLDGLDTTATSTNVCTPSGTQPAVPAQTDGDNGIDNAFGNIIVANLSSFGISSKELSTDIAEGHFTLQWDTTGLDESAGQTNTGLSGAFYAGVKYAPGDAGPAATDAGFSIADNWPVSGAFLTSPTSVASGSTVTFASSYVTNGTWVSGTSTAPVPLTLILEGHTFTVNIHAPIVTMPLTVDASHQFHVRGGIIAGAIDTQEILSSLGPLLAATSNCDLAPVAAALMNEAQDLILSADGATISNAAGTPCNAISVGIEFDADEIAQPSDAVPPPDAGAPGSCASSGSSSNGQSSGSASTGSGASSGSSH